MTDVHDIETRKYNMSQIKGKDTKPEIIVRKYLFANGYRYRLHDKKLPGKPDIVLQKYRTVIFINGCFWHGHVDCKYYTIPATRTEWWKNKIEKTRQLDFQNNIKLENTGWKIITVFECQLKSKIVNNTLNRLQETIKR